MVWLRREVFVAEPRNAGQVDDLVATCRERQANTIHRENPVALSASMDALALPVVQSRDLILRMLDDHK
ncbi:hypothetical protein ACN27G_27070 [Plantactinospora sp. WMMB334]|uniref:hypothetical protein n=1 Tax=Plantactinospora sp. WMMB334 TaxID=3404119 RepID=UPI003B92EB92